MKNKAIKCYIYGIGMQYNILSSYLKLYEDKIQVLALVTTEPQNINRMDGKKIIRPWEMKIDELDYVIVAIKEYKEVFKILNDMGLSDKIIRSEVFSLPNFILADYLRLKESRPSILANSCMGGFIYNDLGLKILSPTINMRCVNYIQFLKNYKYNLSIDIISTDDQLPDEVPSIINDQLFSPNGVLDNSIFWQFLHSSKGSEAEIEWNRRRKRINFDNIVALMIIMNDEEAYEFEKIPIKKKLGFYYKNLNLNSVLYTYEWENKIIRDKFDSRYTRFIHQFYVRKIESVGKIDWIRFLNGKDDFLRF